MNVIEQEVWAELRRDAIDEAEREPALSGHLYDLVIRHRGYPEALAYLIASSLANPVFNVVALADVIGDMIAHDPDIVTASLYDLDAVCGRDPACQTALVPFLYYKGFKGLQAYRVAHALWMQERRGVAHFLQSRISDAFAMDIHPAARIGRGVFIDHGTGIVIGETSVVEDDVSMLQSVTLGGTGKVTGDRHPKIRRGVMIGAGAKILGNIEVGEGSKVAAGSVVLIPVAPHTTVAGVPAKPVGKPSSETPAFDMTQDLEGGG
jgi:serine O-acetyltransferase